MTWDKPLKLHELARGPVRLHLEPEPAEREAIGKRLGLRSLPALTADVTVKPWLDGVEITGRFKAVVEQVCGLSLEPFEQPVEGEIEVRAVPAGSPGAPTGDLDELELDLDAPDAPDVLENDSVDVAGYVVEHLALEIDPFPRKPGATFDYSPPEGETSPFAALAKLKDPKG
ncbi:YceD family protein [Phenylobacterium kunshanense]|uniref:DUF177 domain-containing protein n=1 Tax=Phenylobacterium kunshanense TaxID=1445034 RepID=A0A328BQA2_9CAUL|nr:DUF177 domain-containing protein [Phenylobacterium kunshanense]RAK69247.1 DUF177 domain-containing protein [Phenylobacterium kunshanense]